MKPSRLITEILIFLICVILIVSEKIYNIRNGFEIVEETTTEDIIVDTEEDNTISEPINDVDIEEYIIEEVIVEDPNSYVISGVENVLQNPELPNGCEIVSLDILLNYYGYSIDKVDLLNNYTTIIPIGSDYPTVGYYGNPSTTNSYGCYAPVIEEAANNYLTSCNSNLMAIDITGTEFEDLYSYISNDTPVEIWATMYMAETYDTRSWTMPDGNTYTWKANEHALVMYGYDRENNIAYISDPLVGNTTYDLSVVKQRYEDMGKQAVIIKNKPL